MDTNCGQALLNLNLLKWGYNQNIVIPSNFSSITINLLHQESFLIFQYQSHFHTKE